ncbi:PTS fructose transporter subunit IIABC [Cellulosilyticum lentocellum]|uniref:PTS system, fructose subfamily, IIC subunit n=1 Tax=Cellulosilyticum lentocellum (strain ATCC 49066 / DSM 5427 / NCIMB 11756 / RHM5) TaxID=642492 RepID=F2JJC9_CELLD|nr:fructose-specific PTS transporter subunit EIIC [Cellulosilyticum lentocellum]ADZ85524.1 PTS system, fructose subfamily, IIC subunit [Cellulosilyticum lentocellum DSM 5427]
MRITDLLTTESIDLNFKVNSKSEAINHLVDLMYSTGNISDKEVYKSAILAREDLSTTGIGEGIAIPHAKTSAVKKATLVAAVSKDGVDYEALDGAPSHLFFMIAAPDGANNTHLDVLSRLSTILMDAKFREKLIHANSPQEFLKLINVKETEKFGDVVDTAKTSTSSNDAKETKGYTILAVTACPTGIAHTYMAAEALQNKADEMGISCKVETNGSGGIKNALTDEDIKNATCIIVAADKNVEMNRFDGKKVIITKVANGIHKAEELITKASQGDAPIYHAKNAGVAGDSETQTSEGLGRQLYKHLMNGVSHMLPFVIGGGILIALAFLIDSLLGYTDALGSNAAAAVWFKSIGDAAFGFMLPVLAGYIAMSIGERPALVVGFVGGMLANSGGSGFLGALIAGFAGGYLMVGLKKVLSVLPQSLEGLKPTLLYPVLGVGLIGVAITFIINPPVAFVNTWLTDTLLNMGTTSAVLVGTILAAMMAIDMGGPFNKAAYVVGIAALEAGNLSLMAAVMIGGMVPPLAIALCTTFFKNRFTERERQSGIVNYIMGLSFITEGAIPFAASDPLKVIPACVIGSGIAGALSSFFGCTLNAPHGGIFVLPVIGQPLWYFVSLVVGSVVGAVILGFLKKPLNK